MKNTTSYLLVFSIVFPLVFLLISCRDDDSEVTPGTTNYGTEFWAAIDGRGDLNIYKSLLNRVEAHKKI